MRRGRAGACFCGIHGGGVGQGRVGITCYRVKSSSGVGGCDLERGDWLRLQQLNQFGSGDRVYVRLSGQFHIV